MGYMDSFYKAENIIGYTGDINNNPTVYFYAQSPGVDGMPKTKKVGDSEKILFLNGHITQAHGEPTNVGREVVFESWSYSLMNATSQHDDSGLIQPGETMLQETYHPSETTPSERYFRTPDGFDDFHISRSTFKSVSPKDSDTIKILANAITKCPDAKEMYGPVADDLICTP